MLHELDREVLARRPVRFRGDPPDEEPIPLSDDAFLYLRAGIVAAGRDTYQRVLAEPAVLAEGRWCGLPGQLAAEHVEAVIDVADSWHLEPVVGKPAPSRFGDHREVCIRVTVPRDAVRGWRVDQRRTGLGALAATCLLAVLPDQHAAVPELRRMREAGTGLLEA